MQLSSRRISYIEQHPKNAKFGKLIEQHPKNAKLIVHIVVRHHKTPYLEIYNITIIGIEVAYEHTCRFSASYNRVAINKGHKVRRNRVVIKVKI